jgi:hypothetical protein
MDDRNKKLWMTEHRREYEQKSPDDLIDIRDSCTDLQEPKRILAMQVLHYKDSQMQKKMMRWSVIAGVAAVAAAVFAAPDFLHRFCADPAISNTPHIPALSQTAKSPPQSAESSVPVISTPTPTNRQAQVPAPVFQTNKQNQDVRP